MERPATHVDISVIRTPYAYLKIAEMVVDLLVLVCVGASINRNHSRGVWTATVSGDGMFYSFLMLAFYMCRLPERCRCCPWLLVEAVICLLHVIGFVSAAGICISSYFSHNDEALAAAAFFGILAMIAYAYDGWKSFQKHRNGAPTTAA